MPARSRPEPRITSYEPPKLPHHLAIFAGCLLGYYTFIAHPWIVPGTFIYDKLVVPWFPGGAPWFFFIVRMRVAVPLLCIHLGEAYLLHRTRLSRYGVRTGSGLWWAWVLSCFVEGFGSFQRIDAMLKKQTVELDKVEKEKNGTKKGD
jgi:hypothetical protein